MSPKPIRSFRLRPDGRCGCSACLADEQRDHELRDQALAEIARESAADRQQVTA